MSVQALFNNMLAQARNYAGVKAAVAAADELAVKQEAADVEAAHNADLKKAQDAANNREPSVEDAQSAEAAKRQKAANEAYERELAYIREATAQRQAIAERKQILSESAADEKSFEKAFNANKQTNGLQRAEVDE